MEQELKYIGVVHSELKKIEECPLQENENAPEAEIFLFPEYTRGIRNIAVGSKIILFTWLDKAERDVLECRPRNNPENELIGVFSTRSPNRPNPIGIHLVTVLRISQNDGITVSGLEVINQTPLIDIKSL